MPRLTDEHGRVYDLPDSKVEELLLYRRGVSAKTVLPLLGEGAVQLQDGEDMAALAELGYAYVRGVLTLAGNDTRTAAEVLGVDEQELLRYIDQHAKSANHDA